jgi:hypothetical protein
MTFLRLAGLGALAVCAALSSGFYNPERALPRRDAELYSRGKQLFAAACSNCHQGARALKPPVRSAGLTDQLRKCATALDRARLQPDNTQMQSLTYFVAQRFRVKGASR